MKVTYSQIVSELSISYQSENCFIQYIKSYKMSHIIPCRLQQINWLDYISEAVSSLALIWYHGLTAAKLQDISANEVKSLLGYKMMSDSHTLFYCFYVIFESVY